MGLAKRRTRCPSLGREVVESGIRVARNNVEISRENFELRAGARWPEWITGAGILCAGMILGAILRAITARRARPRLRI